MSAAFFVHRQGVRTDLLTGADVPTQGWVGPIDSADQAEREADAWRAAGHTATVHPDSPDVQAKVAAWQDATIDGWRDSTDPTQRNRWYAREEARRLAARDQD